MNTIIGATYIASYYKIMGLHSTDSSWLKAALVSRLSPPAATSMPTAALLSSPRLAGVEVVMGGPGLSPASTFNYKQQIRQVDTRFYN